MQGLILAAGRGSRLGEGIPKCLFRLGRQTLLEQQIACLRAAGVGEIAVVIGYGADEVRKLKLPDCHFIENQHYATTNSLYSLWMARTWIKGPFVQANSDVIAHPIIYRRIATAKGSALSYDSRSGQSTEHMKVVIRNGRLVEMGKHLPPDECHGENIGILKFDAHAAQLLMSCADQLIGSGQHGAWAPAAVSGIARLTAIRCLDFAGTPWTEIDYVEDAIFARHEIWPSVQQRKRHIVARAAGAALAIGGHLLSSVANLGGMLE